VVIALKRECIPHHCPGLMKVVIIAKVRITGKKLKVWRV